MKVCKNKKCDNKHDGSYGSGNFCSQSCARARTDDKTETKEAVCIDCKEIIQINKRTNAKTARCVTCKKIHDTLLAEERRSSVCPVCGVKGTRKDCMNRKICLKKSLFPKLIKYFGFAKNKLGTIAAYDEYERILFLLEEEYWDNALSVSDISCKYGYDKTDGALASVLTTLGLQLRCPGAGVQNAIAQGKLNLPFSHKYKHGWHTTWNDKKVFYRSSYELELAQDLDELQIDYEMESVRIAYWDSQQQKTRIAIPDFYLPVYDVIIEVKSSWTYDITNMQDKFTAYKEKNYACYLWLDKEFAGL